LFSCFTTVINAAELYAGAWGDEEIKKVDAALWGMKVLGLSSRYAKHIGQLFVKLQTQGKSITEHDCLIAGIALESKLPILTGNTKRFENIPNSACGIIPTKMVEQYNEAETILAQSRRIG
jgi:predicted nucleic acid-binding protein